MIICIRQFSAIRLQRLAVLIFALFEIMLLSSYQCCAAEVSGSGSQTFDLHVIFRAGFFGDQISFSVNNKSVGIYSPKTNQSINAAGGFDLKNVPNHFVLKARYLSKPLSSEFRIHAENGAFLELWFMDGKLVGEQVKRAVMLD